MTTLHSTRRSGRQSDGGRRGRSMWCSIRDGAFGDDTLRFLVDTRQFWSISRPGGLVFVFLTSERAFFSFRWFFFCIFISASSISPGRLHLSTLCAHAFFCQTFLLPVGECLRNLAPNAPGLDSPPSCPSTLFSLYCCGFCAVCFLCIALG